MTVGRFAPSPSGRMHLGNLFAALMSWLSVRSTGGKFLLRIEDLDPQRSRPEYTDQIRRDLEAFGLDWDEEQTPQSRRTEAYEAAFSILEKQDLVYPCFCSRDALHAASAPHGSDGTPVYPGTCASLTPAQRAAQTKPPAWRVRVPDRIYEVHDRLQGPYRENLKDACGDFIIRRADGVYAYQLAVVADDMAGGVTQVVRGRDLLSSAPRQNYLYECLGGEAPEYCHVPLLLAPDGRRLSKRDRDLELGELLHRYTPEAVTGWLLCSCGLLERSEPVAPVEAAKLFSWEKISPRDLILDGNTLK
ncbi:MAG: tRNA glutamyl-Q(34) synthetase GluQRS [Oscillospiraceae bacterium]|nr:tRNA glutamyl-Q(34) synthetase GluQRS [Oscillospiraceae bacterium]